MKLLYVFGCLITLSCTFHSGYCDEQRCDCNVDHTQQMFCEADFAFVGTVLAAEDQTDVYVYEVEISESLIFKGLSYLGVDTEHITIYTPYGASLCGRPNLHKETYLFTGSFMEGKFVITYCNWVQLWDDVSKQQQEYLTTHEYINHCSLCQVYGVKAALMISQNDRDLVYPGQESGLWSPYYCYFNPVASAKFGSEDCETIYSYCHPVEDERCDWKITADYDECFTARERAWILATDPQGAAAITTVKDCRNMETRKKKKKCLKMIKDHLKATEVDAREMLEELMDLREMWLEDDVFDDED